MDHSAAVSQNTLEFISQLGLSQQVLVTIVFSPDQNIYNVLLKTDNPGLIIGYHGENLSALQLLLAQHLHNQVGEWLNLSLNVNDYRQRREASLHALADSAVARVIASGQPHSLPPMPAAERRLVHLYLADHPDVTTASEGVGRSRSVIISPRI
ncbi:hypothetical protein A3H89_03890 [Candidatus Amesbacteria bacterium RIFCSPLOWO2_02_FULL_48_11]|uniref:R3H domain-containing protein n=5 Tax=Candidatus Amesiibacteriota TaxID=1752730 RepID=A0A1F4Z6R7_9BACT|nr:MAG: R3H domain protein [Candidatus Amesbacteria bacterium GW2011_GWA2_47_11]KKU94638.1 MAG: R3H domain protein [Candidatus Amesbacteria bacterium GW2011_GWC1_48_10]KKW00552.1 MAG: R3H domain protein [Candidatus Amesbacteria bacterium GW2011_GWA1_48_9]OGC95230.1 MAG: hypothetical protein A3C34_04625 [Candidatus Amesbacteria bacterium RIFCSPHIGHO2_02_FULL_48_21]OGD00520.1 MAG: hypothetical protein A2702_02220 [Candidatus Amesbacteria bacterium RIFCSPHIGHO2_01_FULL_48_75]OGD01114.1 MAG: hypot